MVFFVPRLATLAFLPESPCFHVIVFSFPITLIWSIASTLIVFVLPDTAIALVEATVIVFRYRPR